MFSCLLFVIYLDVSPPVIFLDRNSRESQIWSTLTKSEKFMGLTGLQNVQSFTSAHTFIPGRMSANLSKNVSLFIRATTRDVI